MDEMDFMDGMDRIDLIESEPDGHLNDGSIPLP